ncbi:MAG: alpha/beta hydrolase, partial [Bacteroidota bacterium]
MKLYILVIVLLLSIFTSCTNQDGKFKIMSPPPPPPTLSSSLAPQPALLPEAPSGLALKQGYFEGKDGVQLFFRMVGSGKDTLVFVHGGPGLGVDDGALDIELIANKNYTFLAYDQRGGGRSELVRDTTKLTMPDHVGDLESLRKHFKIQKLNLIGLSWGSGLITYYHDAFPTNVN